MRTLIALLIWVGALETQAQLITRAALVPLSNYVAEVQTFGFNASNYFASLGSGTNHLVQTNGVTVGSAGTVNWTAGVTGHVSSGVLHLGVSAAGGGGGGDVTTSQLNAASNVLRTDITALQGATNGLHTRAGNLEGATNGLTTRAGNLEGATNGLTTRATNLEGATNGLRADVLNLQGATNGLSTRMGNAEAATNLISAKQHGTQLLTNLNNNPPFTNFSVSAPSDGQVLKYVSANGRFENGTDATGGGSGGGWSGYDAPATNTTLWSSDTNRTNVVIQQRTGQAVPMLSLRGSNNAPVLEFDNRGFLVMTNALTNYSLGNTRGSPPGTIVMGASQAGMPVPAWTDEFARQQELGPAIWNTDQYYIAPGSGTTPFVHGGVGAATGGTTISHEAPDERKPYMVKVSGAATSNSVAGYSLNVNLWNAGQHNGSSRVGGGFFFARWMITNNLAGIVGGGAPRFFVGLANAASPNLTNIANTTNGTGQYLGLMGDIPNSLDMFITCRDGTAEFRTNTGINFVATNYYELSFDEPNTNRFVRWSLRDLTARLEASGMFSNNVPTNFMKMTILCKNGTNRANEIYFSRLFVNPSQSPRWN